MRSFFKSWTAKIKQFSSDAHGGVAMIYAPMSIVLFLAAGVAVDYTRSYMVKKEITRALDAAVLAAGSLAIADEDTMRTTAEQYFDANLTQKTKDLYSPQVNVVVDGDQITVSSTVNVETSLMKIAHVNNLAVAGESVATRALTNVEIALVLDNTGSMGWDGKMTAMKNAANQLVTTMYEPSGSENFVKFAIVPFTGSVNLGVDQTSTWLDTTWVSDAALPSESNRVPGGTCSGSPSEKSTIVPV